MAHDPHVAFALHPALGTVAAVSDGLPQAEAALRATGFEHHADLDLFVLPKGADRRVAVGLIRDLQTVGYTVAADPQLQLSTSVTDTSLLITQIMRAQRPSDIARVFDDLLDDRIGAVPGLHQLLDTTAEWCEKHLGDQGASFASSCRELAHRVTELSDGLRSTGDGFRNVDNPLTPPTATASSMQTNRADAAIATSPAQLGTAAPSSSESLEPYRRSQAASSEQYRSR